MDTCIDARFERLERALSSLIDSVTKYHPSVIQAEELKAADEHLSQGLEQVQAHQNNHIRIQQLRDTSAALDAQIRDALTSLATTRKDMVATHTTKFPAQPNHPVAYEELLRYARRISKTTMPPVATIAAAAAAAAAAGSPSSEMQTPATEAPPHSAVTPAARTPSLTQSPVANGVPAQQHPATLPEGMAQYLNPLSGQLFFPWPLEDKIRSGSLASYQILTEQGIDPRNYDPATEEERKRKEEEERKAKEEREKAEREERERQLRVERERLRVEREKQRKEQQEEWRRASIATGQPDATGPPKASASTVEKKQFQFTNFDDLDDDDDEED